MKIALAIITFWEKGIRESSDQLIENCLAMLKYSEVKADSRATSLFIVRNQHYIIKLSHCHASVGKIHLSLFNKA